MLTRRLLIFAAASALAPGAYGAAIRPVVVTLLGDSITAGLGLSADEALPAQLQIALKGLGLTTIVRAAGVSGDTTAGGLARLDFSVQPDSAICVVELGANDYLQSVDPKSMRTNLTAILKRLKARGVGAVLAANAAPTGGSGAYGREFNAAFADAAQGTEAVVAPGLLKGVLDQPGLRQADGLHPNAAGVKIMARRLAPFVAQAIKAHGRKG